MPSSKMKNLKMILVFAALAALAPTLSGCSILSQILGKGSGPGGSGGGTSGGSWSISGIVIEPNGTGVPGVTISDGANTTLTDSTGNYILSGLPDGSYTVDAAKSGYSFSPSSQSETVNGTNLTGVDFSASQSGGNTYTIQGSVTYSGSPVSGVFVKAGSMSTTTDTSGTYTFSVPDGTYSVTVSYPGDTFTNTSTGTATQSATVNGAPVTLTTFTVVTTNGIPAPPPLPVPISYVDNPVSQAVVVGIAPLKVEFSPHVTSAVSATNGTQLTTSNDPCIPNNPVELLDSTGAIYTSPEVSLGVPSITGCTTLTAVHPLATGNIPQLEIISYWRELKLQGYPAGTNTDTTTYTYGVTQTNATTFHATVGASVTAKAGGVFGSVSATISAQFSTGYSTSLQISSSQTQQETYQLTVPNGQEALYILWQLEYRIALVSSSCAEKMGDTLTSASAACAGFSDSSFTFDSSDMAPLYVDQPDELRPQVTFFTAP